jgi:hypothetical protein
MALEGFESFRMNDYTKKTLERFLAANTRELRAKKRNRYHAPAGQHSHTLNIFRGKSRRSRQEREAA